MSVVVAAAAVVVVLLYSNGFLYLDVYLPAVLYFLSRRSKAT